MRAFFLDCTQPFFPCNLNWWRVGGRREWGERVSRQTLLAHAILVTWTDTSVVWLSNEMCSVIKIKAAISSKPPMSTTYDFPFFKHVPNLLAWASGFFWGPQLFFQTEFGRNTADIHHSILLQLEEKQLTLRKQQFCFLFWLKQLNLSNAPYHLTAITRGVWWKCSLSPALLWATKACWGPWTSDWKSNTHTLRSSWWKINHLLIWIIA